MIIYSGNRVFNLNNIIALIFVVVGVVLFISQSGGNLPLIIVSVAFIITAGQAFYFELTADELITKNYLIPFFNIKYRLNEITQIQLLNTNSRSTAKAYLKVIRGDKRSLGFNAASLGIKDWQSLVDDLTRKKIPIDIKSITLKSTIGIPED